MSWWRALVRRFGSRVESATGGESITAAKQELESRVLSMPGVVSVGLGKSDRGEEVIVVGIDGSRPDLEPQLPKRAGSFPVEIHRIGPIRAG